MSEFRFNIKFAVGAIGGSVVLGILCVIFFGNRMVYIHTATGERIVKVEFSGRVLSKHQLSPSPIWVKKVEASSGEWGLEKYNGIMLNFTIADGEYGGLIYQYENIESLVIEYGISDQDLQAIYDNFQKCLKLDKHFSLGVDDGGRRILAYCAGAEHVLWIRE